MSRSEYDRLDRLTKAIDPDPDGTGSLLPHATTFTYDAAGNLLSQTNGDNETDSFVYDALGRQVRSTDGRGDATVRRYDDVGNLVRLVDPAGNRTDWAYDRYNRVTTETAYEGATPKTRKFIYDDNNKAIRY